MIAHLFDDSTTIHNWNLEISKRLYVFKYKSPDLCIWPWYKSWGLIRLKKWICDNKMTSHLSLAIELFRDIDFGDISKSLSLLYRKLSLLWGRFCKTRPALGDAPPPPPTPPSSVEAPFSTSKLQIEFKQLIKRLNICLPFLNKYHLCQRQLRIKRVDLRIDTVRNFCIQFNIKVYEI